MVWYRSLYLHISFTMCLFSSGTKIQGHQKRELRDELSPMQLWLITKTGDDAGYKIQNANSRTMMDLTDGMLVLHMR